VEALERAVTQQNRIVVLLSSMEWVSYLAVLGAVVALTTQTLSGAQMDGLSGINLEYCKSQQGFQENLLLAPNYWQQEY
jgi:hypothetical protein